MDIEKKKEGIIKKAVIVDTGIDYNGAKVLLGVPMDLGVPPQEFARLYKCALERLHNRARQPNVGDLYEAEQGIRTKIENEECLVEAN